jgi:DNA polymerase eta
VRQIILERFPYLAQVPEDAPNGIDSPLPPPPPISWDGLGVVVPIVPPSEGSEGQSESRTKGNGLDEEVRDGCDESTTWHDVALSIAAELMEKIRDEVRTKLGYTTSAVCLSLLPALQQLTCWQGIARNKFLAKVSDSMNSSQRLADLVPIWTASRIIQEAEYAGKLRSLRETF